LDFLSLAAGAVSAGAAAYLLHTLDRPPGRRDIAVKAVGFPILISNSYMLRFTNYRCPIKFITFIIV